MSKFNYITRTIYANNKHKQNKKLPYVFRTKETVVQYSTHRIRLWEKFLEMPTIKHPYLNADMVGRYGLELEKWSNFVTYIQIQQQPRQIT
jgi:hypothetical protein